MVTAVPGTAYLAAEEVAEHAAAPQVPDDDEAPAVADEDLVGVSRVFLQSLHHLEHPPLAGLLRQPGRGEHREPTPTATRQGARDVPARRARQGTRPGGGRWRAEQHGDAHERHGGACSGGTALRFPGRSRWRSPLGEGVVAGKHAWGWPALVLSPAVGMLPLRESLNRAFVFGAGTALRTVPSQASLQPQPPP